jgi:hypothetical protein
MRSFLKGFLATSLLGIPVTLAAQTAPGKVEINSTTFAPIFNAANATGCKMAIGYLDNDGRVRVADITCPSEKLFMDSFSIGDEMTFEPPKPVGKQFVFRVKKKEKQ